MGARLDEGAAWAGGTAAGRKFEGTNGEIIAHLQRRATSLGEAACHCRPGVPCLTCASFGRVFDRVRARRAAWAAAERVA